MSKNYTDAVAKAQKKYSSGLRQFKFSLSKNKDTGLIHLVENIPNLKAWIVHQLKKENAMKIKVVKITGGRRLIKGKYADILDLDYTQSLEMLQKDIDLVMPSLIENLSLLDNITVSGSIVVHRGGRHIDIVSDGKGSLGWLRIEDYEDEIDETQPVEQ